MGKRRLQALNKPHEGNPAREPRPAPSPCHRHPQKSGPSGSMPEPQETESLDRIGVSRPRWFHGPRHLPCCGSWPPPQGQWPPFSPISLFVASSASHQRRDRKSSRRSRSSSGGTGSCSHCRLWKQSTCFIHGFKAFIIFPSTLIVENLLITEKKNKKQKKTNV